MGFDLLLPFDTDDPEFVRGFEVGRIVASLPAEWRFVVHSSNAEMVIRVGEIFGLRARGMDVGDGTFMEVTFDEV